jgi:hypothetical protein
MGSRKSRATPSDDAVKIVTALRKAIQVADRALKSLADDPPKRKIKRKSKGRG